jgi:hypothetical protein
MPWTERHCAVSNILEYTAKFAWNKQKHLKYAIVCNVEPLYGPTLIHKPRYEAEFSQQKHALVQLSRYSDWLRAGRPRFDSR